MARVSATGDVFGIATDTATITITAAETDAYKKAAVTLLYQSPKQS